MAQYRGTITRLTTAGIWLQIPRIAKDKEIGPCQAIADNYEVGQSVLCATVDEHYDDIIVMGKLQSDMTGIDNSLSGGDIADPEPIEEAWSFPEHPPWEGAIGNVITDYSQIQAFADYPTTFPTDSAHIADATATGRSLIKVATAADTRMLIGLDQVNNTSDAAKPISTATQTALNAKAPIASPTFTGTVSGITAAMVGLGNVNNTSDANKPISTATQTALNAKAPIANPTFTGTVSGVTKGMVGLGNVDNTADTAKPVSTAQQAALDAKAPLASPSFTGIVSGVTASMVGLGAVDNTSDMSKPVSTAQQAALNAKAPLASPTFTGTVGGITKAMVGLDQVDNTSDINKPISNAAQAALNTKLSAFGITAGGLSDITFNSAAVSGTYAYLYRVGPIAYISLVVTATAQITIPTSGNITNTLIGTINSSSPFSHIVYGATANTFDTDYALATTSDGFLAAAYIKANTREIWLGAFTAPGNTSWNVGQTLGLSGAFLLDNNG